jgi:hypothetical protein
MKEPEKLPDKVRLLYIMGKSGEFINTAHPEPAALRLANNILYK